MRWISTRSMSPIVRTGAAGRRMTRRCWLRCCSMRTRAGTRSSQQIERACEEDVAFRVLAAQQRPDHATVARFIERHQDAIAGWFGEVLSLCAQHGLVTVGVIAVDGTKLSGNASRN